MKLPQHLQHFPYATLIIVSDHIAAKFFLVGGEDIEELDGVAVPREETQAPEGPFGKVLEMDDEPRLKQLIKQLAGRIESCIRNHDIVRFHLVMPTDLEHLLSTHLSPDLQDKRGHILHGDFMKESILDIVERLHAA